jgi:hypothetical protein
VAGEQELLHEGLSGISAGLVRGLDNGFIVDDAHELGAYRLEQLAQLLFHLRCHGIASSIFASSFPSPHRHGSVTGPIVVAHPE